MDLDVRVGQVWVLEDGETIELIVRGVNKPVGSTTEVGWITLVLWVEPSAEHPRRGVGELDQVIESAFTIAENGDDPDYYDWKRIV